MNERFEPSITPAVARRNHSHRGARNALSALLMASALSFAVPSPSFGQLSASPANESTNKRPAVLRERLAPAKPARTHITDHVLAEHIVVKFHEGTRVRSRQGRLVVDADKRSATDTQKLRKIRLDDAKIAADLEKVNQLLARGAQRRLERLFARDEAQVDKDHAEAMKKTDEDLADLNLYYRVVAETASRDESAALIDELNALDSVEIAYPEPKSEPAAFDYSPATPNLGGHQGYLNAAPTGIDANYAHAFGGGRGDGVRVIDVEGGWNIYHEDLNWPFYIAGTFSTDPRWVQHGTAVLGEIASAENTFGMKGIAPRVSIGVSCIFPSGSATAINNAAGQLRAGDVMLIELHRQGPDSGLACACNCDQFEYIAVEYWQADYDAIRNATARGIIVVEAAGNGSMNLDSAIYGGRFNRNVRDSGAILVGAGTSNARVPHCWSNYGSRVDVQGWGDSVATLGYGNLLMANGNDSRQWYTGTFSGTSSASPIVTAAAASIQGMRRARGLTPLNSYQMRSLLRQTGTSQGASSRQIGPLPNLRSAYTAHGIAANIYPGSANGWVSGVVAPQGFRDYWFYNTGSHSYQFATCFYADFDTVIEVFNPAGTRIAISDDACALKSDTTVVTAATGWHRVRVRGYGMSAGFFWMSHRRLW